MQIKFCKLICTREENVRNKIVLVHRKRCALKAIVQMAQCGSKLLFHSKAMRGFATAQNPHTTRQHKTHIAVSLTTISSATFYFQKKSVFLRCHVQLCIAASAEKVICAFSQYRAPSLFLRNHACAFERIYAEEINQKCKSRDAYF
jgi:hypothetical protein